MNTFKQAETIHSSMQRQLFMLKTAFKYTHKQLFMLGKESNYTALLECWENTLNHTLAVICMNEQMDSAHKWIVFTLGNASSYTGSVIML